jgi:hypothetical protein
MATFPLSEFLILLGLALLGTLAVLPYSLALSGSKLPEIKIPKPLMLVISVLQTTILMAVATGVGLLAAKPVGLGAPYLEAALAGEPLPGSILGPLLLALGLSLAVFSLIALFERYVFAPHVPAAIRQADVRTQAWKRFLASFYGGLGEEILMRLFLVSGLVWLLGRFWTQADGMPAVGAYWTAIVLASVLFGLGHLPTTKALAPLTPMLIVRAVVLNGIGGITFGWLYWQYGLEAAMISHFGADILLHLVGPAFADPEREATTDEPQPAPQ